MHNEGAPPDALIVPRYMGLNGFARLPVGVRKCNVGIVGLPFDGGKT